MTERERAELGRLVTVKRERDFKSKQEAYTKAGLNSATWDRIEGGLSTKPQSVRAALRLLWPFSEGNWVSVLNGPIEPAETPFFGGSYDDPDYLSHLEGWVRQLETRLERVEQFIDQGAHRDNPPTNGAGDPGADSNVTHLPPPNVPAGSDEAAGEGGRRAAYPEAQSKGRADRRRQDEEGEAPDPEGPPEGA